MSKTNAVAPSAVSVLMPTFNRAGYLVEAIRSVLAQDAPPAEVIVIDDGSDDDTAQAVATFGDQVRYLRQENSGKSAALNLGLSHASGDLIWIFDDDDIAEPDALSVLTAALDANPQAGFAYGLCDKFYGEWPSAVTEPNTSYVSDNRRALYVRLLEDFFIWQGSMLARRRCYDEAGPFDVRMARSQDYEMNLRLARRFPGVGVSHLIFHQRHHAGVRGPRAQAVKADGVEAAWKKFNQIIFSEVHAGHDLDEFYIDVGDDPGPGRRRATALMQRACIMARKGLWPQAVHDFELAADCCAEADIRTLNRQETAALRRVFQGGARSAFGDEAQARALAAALRRFPSPGHAALIRGNLLLPVSHRLRNYLAKAPAPPGERSQLLMLMIHLAGPSALLEYWRARRDDLVMYAVRPLEAPAASLGTVG